MCALAFEVLMQMAAQDTGAVIHGKDHAVTTAGRSNDTLWKYEHACLGISSSTSQSKAHFIVYERVPAVTAPDKWYECFVLTCKPDSDDSKSNIRKNPRAI